MSISVKEYVILHFYGNRHTILKYLYLFNHNCFNMCNCHVSFMLKGSGWGYLYLAVHSNSIFSIFNTLPNKFWVENNWSLWKSLWSTLRLCLCKTTTPQLHSLRLAHTPSSTCLLPTLIHHIFEIPLQFPLTLCFSLTSPLFYCAASLSLSVCLCFFSLSFLILLADMLWL